MRYKHDEMTGHRCLYNPWFAIGWLPKGTTHWIWEWPYVHIGLGRLQFCYMGD